MMKYAEGNKKVNVEIPKDQNKRRRIDFFSFAIVCALSTQYLYILGTHFGFQYSGTIGPLLSFLFFTIGILAGYKLSIRVSSLILLTVIFLQYAITKINAEQSTINFFYFVSFSIIPIIISSFYFNMEKVVVYTCYTVPAAIFILDELFVTRGSFGQMQMGYSYAIMPAILATMIHFRLYRKRANVYMVLCYIFSFYILVRMLLLAVRGSVLTIIIAIIVLILVSYNKDGTYAKKRLKNIIIILAVGFASIFILYNIESVLGYLFYMFSQLFGEVPSSILKTISAISNSDIDHGRSELYSFTINAILNKPFIGHGISTFKYFNYLYEYPHNCLLQLLFEGGLIGAFIPLLYIFYGVWNVFFEIGRKNMAETAYGLLILLSTFPMLLLSNNMWQTPSFWIFVVYGGKKLNEKIKLKF
jgi:O-antigen ligase